MRVGVVSVFSVVSVWSDKHILEGLTDGPHKKNWRPQLERRRGEEKHPFRKSLRKMSTATIQSIRRSKDESAKNFNKDLAVAEGVKTSLAVHLLAEKLGVEMPICASVYEVIHKGSSAGVRMALRAGPWLSNHFKAQVLFGFVEAMCTGCDPNWQPGIDIKTALKKLQDRPLRDEHDEYQGTWVWSAL